MLDVRDEASARTCALTLALALVPAPVLAQHTDGRWQLAFGIVPLAYVHGTVDLELGASEEFSDVRIGLGGQASLQGGYGVGPWLLGAELAVQHRDASVERIDITTSASVAAQEVSQTRIGFGPVARYLFDEGDVRPFATAGAGVTVMREDVAALEVVELGCYAGLGPGVQLRLVDFASIDLLVRGQYAASWGERASLVALVAPTGTVVVSRRVDVDERSVSLALELWLSVWL
jgi:hypothetical protein